MNRRVRVTKSILWALVGVCAVVTVARFFRGLGPTTGLSDAAPWGLWIAFDVMGGVALAAGGFVLAATVHIFGMQRFRPFLRPAILTAFLGYVAVAVGLLYDLGLPWRIWHPMIYPQHHSVLFEVAMCVMFYLTVLALEFAPVVLEHRWFSHGALRSALGILKKVTVPLVIVGIVLSTLHQSSLGSLFLIAPYRLHALWYSPNISALFFISAIGLGLATVIMESLVSGWLFGHRTRTDLLSRLGLAASIVLGFYVAVRLGDLAVQGNLGSLFEGSWQSLLFSVEIAIAAIIPAALLAIRRVRSSAAGLAACSSMVILGVVLNRFSVSILAFARWEGMAYRPVWTEIAVSLGIVSAAALVFLFFTENFKVYEEDGEEEEEEERLLPRSDYHPGTLRDLTPESIAAPRRYSLMVVVGATLAVYFLPEGVFKGPQARETPTFSARSIEGAREADRFVPIRASENTPDGAKRFLLMALDGNRDGDLVFFAHDEHIARQGNEESCATCHHQNMPLDRNTACFECHRDMYEPTDIFNHASHVRHLGANRGCAQCHEDPSKVKSRETAARCDVCHSQMEANDRLMVEQDIPLDGIAPGYMNAMHGLCVTCHENSLEQQPTQHPANLKECRFCHQTADDTKLERVSPTKSDKERLR